MHKVERVVITSGLLVWTSVSVLLLMERAISLSTFMIVMTILLVFSLYKVTEA